MLKYIILVAFILMIIPAATESQTVAKCKSVICVEGRTGNSTIKFLEWPDKYNRGAVECHSSYCSKLTVE